MIEKKYNYIKPRCPRCGREDTRADEKKSQLKCKVCGYPGHWRQFFEGEKARESVQELFAKGNLDGDPFLGNSKKPI